MDLRSSFLVSSLPSSASSFLSSGSDEDKSGTQSNWVRAFEDHETDPFRGGFKIKEEEGRYVITYTEGLLSARGKKIKRVEYVPIDTILPPVSSIERDLRLLNLSSSSSSSFDSLSPPPQFPFPWADTGADGGVKILSVDEITSKLGIMEIRGEVECTNCHQSGTIGFDLKTKSFALVNYVEYSSLGGYFRADHWVDPILDTPCPSCCGTGRLKPVIPENDIDYKKINWLFLFLDQMLGFCSVEQLNLFCKT